MFILLSSNTNSSRNTILPQQQIEDKLTTTTNNMRLCPVEVLERGFSALNAYGPEFKPKWCKARVDDFKQFYGSTPVVFKPRKFKERIYQEVRRVKFLNYLEQKRAEKGLN